ncbi:hypothetical protein BC939DRAFT_479060 [Gamsiella multidivaricata]|uniref:uncharacterized protein n=1 Tax=Gamsiella multidivaricata TaxID=101098 RepID=UPI00221E5A3F|nr:uncharacterized protein BC939DRAFT_479060 [Gamsiella multidivaricata]KAI7820331.1 hypothetical protein BC939DRAFT_479060 [Gamsiella multidivaricata]
MPCQCPTHASIPEISNRELQDTHRQEDLTILKDMPGRTTAVVVSTWRFKDSAHRHGYLGWLLANASNYSPQPVQHNPPFLFLRTVGGWVRLQSTGLPPVRSFLARNVLRLLTVDIRWTTADPETLITRLGQSFVPPTTHSAEAMACMMGMKGRGYRGKTRMNDPAAMDMEPEGDQNKKYQNTWDKEGEEEPEEGMLTGSDFAFDDEVASDEGQALSIMHYNFSSDEETLLEFHPASSGAVEYGKCKGEDEEGPIEDDQIYSQTASRQSCYSLFMDPEPGFTSHICENYDDYLSSSDFSFAPVS